MHSAGLTENVWNHVARHQAQKQGKKRFKKAWQNELFKRNAPRGGEFNPTLD